MANDIKKWESLNQVALTERGCNLATFGDVLAMGDLVCQAGMAPDGLQTPEKIAIAAMYGRSLGLDFWNSLRGIMVINNRPSVWGDAMLAVCRKSGLLEDYRVEWINDTKDGTSRPDNYGCRVTVKRKDLSPITAEFTIGDAKRAGLWGKVGHSGKPSPWVTYPRRMMEMRARGFALRDAFADILGGLISTEELQDYPPEAFEVVESKPRGRGRAKEPEIEAPEPDARAFIDKMCEPAPASVPAAPVVEIERDEIVAKIQAATSLPHLENIWDKYIKGNSYANVLKSTWQARYSEIQAELSNILPASPVSPKKQPERTPTPIVKVGAEDFLSVSPERVEKKGANWKKVFGDCLALKKSPEEIARVVEEMAIPINAADELDSIELGSFFNRLKG